MTGRRVRLLAVACLLLAGVPFGSAQGSDNSGQQGSDNGAGTDQQNAPATQGGPQGGQQPEEDSSGGNPTNEMQAQAQSTEAAGPPAPPAAASATPWGAKAALYNRIGWPSAPNAPPPFAPGTIIPPPPPGTPSHPAPHGPPAPPPTELSFFVIGDWGGQDDWPMTTVAQTQCAAAMAKTASLIHPQFIISTGDNFYESGVQGVYACRPTRPCSLPCVTFH